MVAKLHIALSHFHPAFMNSEPASDELYGHDANATFLIAQPFVFTAGESPDLLDPLTYFREWNTGTSPQPTQLNLIDRTLALALNEGRITAVPVPFPPGTELGLSLKGLTESGQVFPPFHDRRVVGGASWDWDHLDASAASGWPGFAVLSNALPTVRAYADLDGGDADGQQHIEAFANLLGVFSEMVEVWGNQAAPTVGPRELVHNQVVVVGLQRAPLSDTRAWRTFLDAPHPSGQSNFAWSYDQLVGQAWSNKPYANMHRPAWLADKLETKGSMFLEGKASRSYLEVLWAQLIEVGLGDPGKFVEVLSRLFGFGERLAWPIARIDAGVAASKRFMVLRDNLAAVTGAPAWVKASTWAATNMVSLAGQVFRIRPFDRSDPPTQLCSATLDIGGATLGVPADLALQLNDYFSKIAAQSTGPIKLRPVFASPRGMQTADPAATDRSVIFAARKGPLAKLAKAASPSARTLYAVPQGLLDVVDNTPRTVGGGPGELATSGAPRRGLFLSELLDMSPLSGSVARHYRRTVTLAPVRLNKAAGGAFSIRPGATLAAAEAAMDDLLARIVDGAVKQPAATLWIPQDGPSKSTVGFALDPTSLVRDHDGQILIVDSDNELRDLVSKIPGVGSSDTRPSVDLAFDTTAFNTLPFDVIEFSAIPATEPSIALASGAVTRLSMTADRIAQAVALTWDGLAFDNAGTVVDPRTDQAADTNKVRLRLSLPGKLTRNLSEPDAQLPLPPTPQLGKPERPWYNAGALDPNGPQAFFWLAEHFDQDSSVDGEDTRFITWTRAGEAFQVSGYAEHQYGHRLQLKTNSVDLRRASDLESPAAVRVALREDGTSSQGLPLLGVEETFNQTSSSIGRRLVVGLYSNAVKIALARFDQALSSSNPAHGDVDRIELDRNADIRAIYRSLAELRDAMHANTATILIEPWHFDAEHVVKHTALDSAPALAAGLAADAPETIALHLPMAGTPLANVFAALDTSFDDFRVALAAAVKANSGPFWATLYDCDSDLLGKHHPLLRVGLKLDRPASRTVDSGWTTAPFVPIAESGPEAGRALADSALTDLDGYLTSPTSRLRTSLRWLPAKSIGGAVRGGLIDGGVGGAGSHELLILDAPLAPVPTVVDLFYMPYALKLPPAHPSLNDRQASFDFVAFLLRLIEDDLAGRPTPDVEIAEAPVAEVVARRRQLRALLVEPGGIVDQILQQWDSVYPQPGAAMPPEPQEQLLWLAHRMTLALDAVAGGERPLEVVGRMLADRPTLYATARAFAIVPFKTAVPEGGAAPANSSTFSHELMSVALTKHLFDDSDEVTEDTSTFSATAFHGGLDASGQLRVYLIDVLPDGKYDDTIEIGSNIYRTIDPLKFDLLGEDRATNLMNTRGDAFARRGDDAIQPDAPETFPHGIEANVVHAIPHWRHTRTANGAVALHNTYRLPERLVPPLPRRVNGFYLVGTERKPAASSQIALDIGEVAPPASGGLPRIDVASKWVGAYGRALTGYDRIDVPGAGATFRSFRRIRPAAGTTEPLLALPVATIDDPEGNSGWHLITTSLSHFWFEIDLQKNGLSVQKNLDDDVYEVEVELWPNAPPETQPPPSAAAEPPPPDDPLLLAFRRSRASRSGGAVSTSVPKVADLAAALGKWFGQAPSGAPYYGRRLFDAPATAASARESDLHSRRVFRIKREASRWTITERNPVFKGGLGAALGFEILARVDDAATQGPRYDDVPALSNLSALIRISVLDHPFHISRARLRILRNWADVDGDDLPDINPAFELVSPFSDWATEGRDPLVVSAETFDYYRVPLAGRELQVVPPGGDWSAELGRWIDAIDDATDPSFDYGAALPRLLSEPVFIDEADNNRPKSLWEQQTEMGRDTLISAVVYQTIVDPSLRFGASGKPADIPQRNTSSPRQILGSVMVGDLDKLLNGLKPHQIGTTSLEVELTWRNADGMPTMRMIVPLRFAASDVYPFLTGSTD